MDILSDYEIFLRGGTSFTIKCIKKLEISAENGKITELTIGGTEKIGRIEYISLSDIVCVVKLQEYTKKWWNK